jgi:uncharacterized protein (DUF885 family)
MSASTQFEGILERYFEETLKDQPTYAASVGLKHGEGKLEHATLEAERKQAKRSYRALKDLEALSPRELSNEQHLDRLAFRSLLLREQEDFERKRYSLDPSAVQSILNILLHELQRGEDEPLRAAKNLRSLLKAVPRYLSEAITLIDRPERVWREVAIQTSQGVPTFLKAVATFLQQTHSKPSDATLLRKAQTACDNYQSKFMKRAVAPAQSFAVGKNILQRRIHDELGLDYSLGEIESLALSEIRRIEKLLHQVCAPFGRNKTPDQIIHSAREAWNPKTDLLTLYRKETTAMAQAFRRAKAMSFPSGDSLDVRPVPEFMRSLFPTAAYSAPGAFEKRQKGTFWVNDLSLTKTTEEGKKAERAQHYGLSLTCAHEAYPGHHLQFVTANQHPRKWRRLFAHAVFYEGWTLWCEQMMVDLKIKTSPWLKIQQLHDALWRCHRIIVDLRLQTKRYTYEEAVKHMQRNLGFTRSRAQADVNWYTKAPGVPMSYWLGRLENERLRQRLMVGRGWSLKKFNDWLLSYGTIPQSWIEKYGLD